MPFWIFFPSAAFIPPAPTAPLTGQESFLTSYWSLDNVDLGSVLDVIGLNDATNINTLTGAVGQVNEAFEFDGYTSYVTIPNDLSMESHINSGGGLSFSCWVKPSYFGVTQTVFSKFDSSTDNRAYRFQLSPDGYVTFEVSDPTATSTIKICSQSAIAVEEWSQIAFIYDNRKSTNLEKLQIMINGALASCSTVSSTGIWSEASATTADVLIGAENPSSPTSFYAGLIDEVLIWCGALNPIKLAGVFDTNNDGYRLVDSLPDPTSYWTLDNADLSGTTVLDVVGTNDGYNIGAVTGFPGVVNETFYFDGTTSEITITDDTSLDPELEDYAGACWFKASVIPPGSAEMLITKRGGGSAFDNFAFYINGTGKLTVVVSDDISGTPFVLVENPTLIEPNVWYHGFFRIDRTNDVLELYQDGYFIGRSGLSPIGSLSNAIPLRIGREPTSQYFDGYIDEVAIWKGIIPDGYGDDTSARILYNYGVPNVPSPVSYWTMDDDTVDSGTLFDRMRRLDGTIAGPADGYVGQVNQSFLFTPNDFIDFDDSYNSVLTGADAQWSFSCWLKPNSTMTNNFIFSKWADVSCGEDNRQFLIRLGAGSAPNFFFVGDLASVASRSVIGTTPITDTSKWYHIFVTYDGSIDSAPEDRVTMYVDGLEESLSVNFSSGSFPFDIPSNGAAHLSFGQYVASTGVACGSGLGLDGYLDEAIVFDSVLNQRQIEWVYAEGAKQRTIHSLCDPDGYEVSEASIALVNFASAFNDFQDAIDLGNADAAGAYPLPIAYWSMDNSDYVGTTVIDAIQGANAVEVGTPTEVAGQIGQARSLDGSTEGWNIAAESLFDFDTGDPFSVSLWVNIPALGSFEPLVNKTDHPVGGADPGWNFLIRPGGELQSVLVNVNSTAERSGRSVGVITAGSFQHVMFTYDGSNDTNGMTFYINGVDVGLSITTNTDPGSILNNRSVEIGKRQSTGSPLFSTGDFDETAIWDVELTATQVFEIYSRGATNQKLVS